MEFVEGIYLPAGGGMAIKYPFRFSWSNEIEEKFKEKSIYLSHHNKIEGVFKAGEQLMIRQPIIVEPYATMPRRNFISISAFSYSISAIGQDAKIGRYCSIAKGVEKLGIAHPIDRITTHLISFRQYYARGIEQSLGRCGAPAPFTAEGGPVTVGNDVWIGQNVLIQQGIKIGDGAIVAAGSVVTKDVPPFAVVGGVPARVIKYRLTEDVRTRAVKLRWWQFSPDQFAHLQMDKPSDFLDGIEKMIDEGVIEFAPDRIDIAEMVDLVINGKTK